MEERLGFVRSELEIKTLTLYVLNYAKIPVTFDELLLMAFVDDAIDYFDFSQYLAQMVDSGHVSVCDDTGSSRYSITAKGVRDLNACRSSVPHSVLRKAEKAADKVIEDIKRHDFVEVSTFSDGNRHTAAGKLKDENGELFSFSMTASSAESAKSLTANFYRHAERIYNEFLKAMLDTSDDK